MIKEIKIVRSQGVNISPENLIIAENTPLILPIHGELDRAREDLNKVAKIGTTGRGIGPALGLRCHAGASQSFGDYVADDRCSLADVSGWHRLQAVSIACIHDQRSRGRLCSPGPVVRRSGA